MADFSNYDDTIDVRDIIARVEELREERDDYNDPEAESPNMADWADANADDANELETLESLLSDMAGSGGDEQWEGEWYPVTLIRDSYFESAMDELLEDIGELPKDLPCYLSITVDYKALQMDYTSVEYYGVTYWYR